VGKEADPGTRGGRSHRGAAMSRPGKARLSELESRPCRRCGAEAGQPCETRSGILAEIPHAERYNDADKAAGSTHRPLREGWGPPPARRRPGRGAKNFSDEIREGGHRA